MSEIQIGKYTLAEWKDDEHLQNAIWIRHESGEASTFDIKDVEEVIHKFYEENF